MKTYDIAVVGSGISGLFFCLKASEESPDLRIALITKFKLEETNTFYAQGGFACVSDLVNDSFEKHIKDTLVAGDGLCDEKVVEFVVKEAPERVKDLTEIGVDWDQKNEQLSLSTEGGHSEKRVIHHKDFTGKHIQTALIERLKSHPAIDIFENTATTELLTNPTTKECNGVEVLMSDGELCNIVAKQTILASGGAGQVYSRTTNSIGATGDGIVMAQRAGAQVVGMQFIQFHPTSFYPKIDGRVFLISEALRGEGAILRNHEGEAFMEKYDSRGSLAPRDVVPQSIHNECVRAQVDHLFLDCTHLDAEVLKTKFPSIYKVCSDKGYPLDREWIPITPAAHYTCGGIQVNHFGETTVPGLYAIGECSHTGLHGANRLASNSLLEGVVFAQRAAKSCLEKLKDLEPFVPVERGSQKEEYPDLGTLSTMKTQIQTIMLEHAGIVRTHKGLEEALRKLDKIRSAVEELLASYKKNKELVELDFLSSASLLIVQYSIDYPENRGVFCNSDLVW